MEKISEILSNTFLFKGISKSDIESCCSFEGYEVIKYSKNDIMLCAKSQKRIGIIIEGRATIISGDDGVIIKKLSSNDIYGVAILFDEPEYLTKVIATSTCTVLTISREFVQKCIEYNHKIALNYIEYLANKISFLNNKISAYTAKSAENKLYSYLLQLPRNENVITLKTDFSAIAKMIGIGRASLYRAFDKLEESGLIVKNKKEIILCEV
ncbi:MAG: Crp/Fnr family transcriptional regulator [Clostridia bacterium]|nr:Crp/Fnr family transcriptional regulator [Clostridia bacterium]